jgi:hypothetical protein
VRRAFVGVPAESYTALTDHGDRLRAIGLLQQKAAALEAGIVRQRRSRRRCSSATPRCAP